MQDTPEATGIPPALILVRCDFALPQFGDTTGDPGTGQPGDPLLKPAAVLWSRQTVSEATDIDRLGRKIRNAAGDGFTPKLTRPITSRLLSITKNLPLYPFELDDAFTDCVNSDPVTFTGSTFVYAAETMKCLGISAPEFAVDATFVPCTLNLEIRSTRTQGRYPFRTPVVNQGRRGWYTEGTTTKSGEIWDAKGNAVSEDILLNNDGKPIDTTLTVQGFTPVANPSSVNGWIPDPDAPGPAVIMLWNLIKGYGDFDGLFRGMGLL